MNAPSAEAVAFAERYAVMRGDLRPLMTRTQRLAWHKFLDVRKTNTRFIADCCRRWGKTFFGVMAVHMEALEPDRVIRYSTPTKDHGRKFAIPTFQWLAKRLPPHMVPHFNMQTSTWTWPNGSVCYLGSCDTKADADAQVGTSCHLAVVDEARIIPSDILKHLMGSVLRPQFLTTGGNVIVMSTPPITPAHYYTKMVEQAEAKGALVGYTVDDCEHISADEIEKMKREILEEEGGDDTTIQRELYRKHIADKTALVVPEFQDVMADVICERERPEWLDWYCAADFGFSDMTVVLYAWFDFEAQTIYVEHEIVMQRKGSLEVGHACKALEAELGIRPLTRVADAPLQQLADISNPKLGAGIDFALTQKDDADVALAHLRNQILRRRIHIHPRCTTLIAHLKYVTWNARRTDYDRTTDLGHGDAIDALKYLNRTVNRRKNPAPIIPVGAKPHTHFIHPDLVQASKQRQRVPLGRGGQHVR